MIDESYPYTYTSFSYTLNRDQITKSDFVGMCEELTKRLGYPVVPEPISEGGFLVKVPPSDGVPSIYPAYKSCRLGCTKWPWLHGDNIMEEWKGNMDVLLEKGEKQRWVKGKFVNGTIVCSVMKKKEYLPQECVLKAFHGAPCWTVEEIHHLLDVLGGTLKGKIPKNLHCTIRDGKLGVPLHKKENCPFQSKLKEKINRSYCCLGV